MAKHKTVIELAEMLKAKGNSVTVKKRKDGGYLITEINGIKYTGAKGNSKAREITGSSLPETIVKRNIKVTEKKKSYKKKVGEYTKDISEIKKRFKETGVKRKAPKFKTNKQAAKFIETHGMEEFKKILQEQENYTELPKTLLKAFKKTYDAWEESEGLKGKLKIERAFEVYQEEGYTALLRKLRANYRYAKGFANSPNLMFFREKCVMINRHFATTAMDKVINYIDNNLGKIKDESLMVAYDILYDVEHFTEAKQITNEVIESIITALSHK